MVTFSVRRISAKSMFLAALAAVLLLAVLFTGAQTAAAQTPGVNYETGNVCIDRYQPGSVCTANDVRIATLTPSISEACLGVGLGETTTVQFVASVETTSTDRYDIGFFIARDGGSAQTGNSCYHDFLQPAVSPQGATPPVGWQTTGVGPYRNTDGDVCADTKASSNDGNILYKTQVPVTITCIDADNDGFVDPVSTCTSWDNNSNSTCTNVTQAFPGTNSKCNCSTADTNIKIYRGLDGGDLPDSYGTLFSSGGASHSIQDSNSNNTPDTIGGQVAIWLGSTVDYAWVNPTDETTAGGFPDPDALGDDNNNTDDEDGVAFPAPWYAGANGGQIQFLVNASGSGECTLGNDCTVVLWLDWDNSGTFNNTLFNVGGERYEFQLTGGTGINYLRTFDTPDTWTVGEALAARVRLYDNAPGSPAYSPVGLVTNGEVEDYIAPLGTLSVTLNDFSAVCQDETPLIRWETASEVDTQGFNLYRGVTAGAWDTQLNPTMILAQNPGNTQGGSYQWVDTTALPDVEYFYWLQDVAFNNATGLHGPISVTCLAPTAVSLSSLGANTPASSALTWWVAALAMAGLLLGVIIWQRQAQTR